MVVAEGNVFQNVNTPLLNNKGQLFSAPSTGANGVCQTYLGHTCQLNSFGSSGSFSGTQTDFLVNFQGKTVAGASAASSNVANTAGVGKI